MQRLELVLLVIQPDLGDTTPQRIACLARKGDSRVHQILADLWNLAGKLHGVNIDPVVLKLRFSHSWSGVSKDELMNHEMLLFVCNDDTGRLAIERSLCVANKISGLFGNHHDRGVRVAIDEFRHDRGVSNAQAVDSMDTELTINNSV